MEYISNDCSFYCIIFYSMISMISIKSLLISSLLLAFVTSQTCGKGGLACTSGSCHYPRFIQGCLQYQSQSQCAECEYNYKKVGGLCQYSPNSYTDCCSQFDSNSVCSQCKPGLILNKATNLCEDILIRGCLQKNQIGCVVCSKQYDLVGNICMKSISNCVRYDTNNHCISCSQTSILINGVCLPLVKNLQNANCKNANQFGCYECQSGYWVSDGVCKADLVTGCLAYDKLNICIQCASPYYKLSNGTCLIVGCLQSNGKSCQKCDTSLGFTLKNSRCQIINCVYFSSKGCSLCKNNKIASLKGCLDTLVSYQKVCLICKNNEYMGNDGVCYKKDLHCTLYENGKCQKCCDGYLLTSVNSCIAKRPGCIYTNDICSSCAVPFNFANNACSIDGCISYQQQGCKACQTGFTVSNYTCTLPNCEVIKNLKCAKCSQGYQFDSNNNCILSDPYCISRNSFNICLKCATNYQLNNNNICTPILFGCNYVDNRCTSCRAPFTYVPATESCVIDGCIDYFFGGCQKCANLYSLIYNNCKLPNCLISKAGKCLQCDPDYIFNSAGNCVNKDQFCDKMDQNGTCIKCMYTYFYSKSLKKCIKKSPGCRYDDSDKCCSCDSPFTLKDQRCVIEGCLTLGEQGCLECSYPFQLNKDNICVIPNCASYVNNTCRACLQGYVLNNLNLCVKDDPYCLTYNDKRTQCTKCVKGYMFDENGNCEYSDQHCWNFDIDGRCTNCDRLYFLNPYGKCQLRDPQCSVYTNGYCSVCKSYFYVKGGICLANLKGCKTQIDTNRCTVCQSGYNIQNGICVVSINRLSWDSIDMDFFDDSQQSCNTQSSQVFTVGINTKVNLLPIISSDKCVVEYSSSSLNNASFSIDTDGNNGWCPLTSNNNEFIGIKTKLPLIFYAIDIKVLQGNSLSSFILQYSEDGRKFENNGNFSLDGVLSNTIKTFYFKPVEAKSIRIVPITGRSNIKLQIYYSNSNSTATSQSNSTTFINQTILQTLDDINGGLSVCAKNASKLCWAGVQSCEPKTINSFDILYTNSADLISEISVDYSIDGITYTCWNSCKSIPITPSGHFDFSPPLLAQKARVMFNKYNGNPKFGIRFNYA